jgi:hypothetical protein
MVSAGGNFLAHCLDELPGADEMLAGGIVGHAASFNASPRRSKVPLGRREEYGGGRPPRREGRPHRGRIRYGRGSSFI